MKRSILLVFTDPHGGHRLGLCNPDTILEDDTSGKISRNPVELNDAQVRLWEIFTGGIEEVKKLAGKDSVYAICLGDVTHGTKHVQEQLTTRLSDQLLIAKSNFYPLFDIKTLKALRIVKGTDAHSLGEGSSEIAVAEMLQSEFPKVDIRTIYHGLLHLNDLWIDYSHHGPPSGSRRWLEGNEARLYLRSIMMTEIEAGHTPPQLILRGHVHHYVKEYLSIQANGTEFESWLTIVPSMDLISGFARQVTKSTYRVKNGIVAYEIINGRVYNIHFFGNTLDVRTFEEF